MNSKPSPRVVKQNELSCCKNSYFSYSCSDDRNNWSIKQKLSCRAHFPLKINLCKLKRDERGNKYFKYFFVFADFITQDCELLL